MRRLLMLVGVGVVAAAMYVAASSAGQVSKGVPVAKFNALSKKVAALTKTVNTDRKKVARLTKTVNYEANLLNGLANAYAHCSLSYAIGVTQRGDLSHAGGFGYQYIPQGSTTPDSTTALDLDTSGSPEFLITPFNATDPACMSLIGSAPARHNSGKLLAQFTQRR
jgi:hypothetical protein